MENDGIENTVLSPLFRGRRSLRRSLLLIVSAASRIKI
jgi:hypothetical protein